MGDHAGPALTTARRTAPQGPRRAWHPDQLPVGQVAGEPEERPRRQAHGLEPGNVGCRARRPGFARPRRHRALRRPELRPLLQQAIRRRLRADPGLAGRTRARTALSRSEAHAGCGRALPLPCASHTHRPRVALADRLSPSALFELLLAVRRHRHRSPVQAHHMKARNPLSPRRRATLQAMAAAALGLPSQAGAQATPSKTLRYAFQIAETGMDPVALSDLYSRILTAHIFDNFYEYDHLARPFKIRPCTADGMPEISDDFRTYTVRIKPGIYFQDDPVFKGQKRELVAQDYV